MRRAPFYCLLLSVVIAALTARAAEPPAVLKDVKRIVVLGDSISQAGDYVTDLDCWFATQDIPVEIISLGLGSETVSDLTPEEKSRVLRSRRRAPKPPTSRARLRRCWRSDFLHQNCYAAGPRRPAATAIKLGKNGEHTRPRVSNETPSSHSGGLYLVVSNAF